MRKLAALMLAPLLALSLTACSSEGDAPKEEVLAGLQK